MHREATGFAVRRRASEMTKGLAGEVQMSGRRRLPRKGPPSVCRDVAIGDLLIVAFV